MVRVDVGKEYPVESIKTGEGKNGAWAMCSVKADKGYDRITIWADNPTHQSFASANYVKVIAITSSCLSAKQTNGKWYPQYSINATIEGVYREQAGGNQSGFMALPPADDGDLPLPFNF